MAARQASQSNAMLYSMITFVALFVIAAVFAVIYYVKSEDFRITAEELNTDVREDKEQLRGVQEIVNNLYAFILGQQAAEKVSAAMQFNEISVEITKLNKDVLGQDVNPAIGPNGVALLKTIEGLKLKLDNSRTEIDDLEGINEDLQIDLDNATAQVEQNRQDFLAELEQFQSSYDKTRESFDNLKADMDNATAEQIETFQAKLDAEQSKLRQKQLDLQATEKKLDDSDTLLQDALTKLEAIKPKPDQEAQAYKPDAQIVRIDSQNGIIYLDAGIKDHVYRGLTFAIYDRNKPIPENGEGKAEIEVFQVSEQVSAARIVKSDTKDPIAKEDIVANLIWDRNTPNQFVVAGDFDFNKDGLIDTDGAQRIAELIERYGGTVADTITVDTDFLIVGVEPASLRRPTQQ
ncbi:MAG: BRCT domain-containing protein, partial [Planctomycetota bacterium]